MSSFAKLKSFNAIMCLTDFSKKAKNENKWVKINTQNPRIWIDVEEDFSILVNEDWFSEIVK